VPKRAIVEISPSRLEVALLKGARIIAAAAERLDPAQATDLPAILRRAAERLPALIASCNAQGAHATVLYQSTTAAVSTYACPSSAGAAGAERAARLAMAESAGFPLNANPHAVRPLARDRTEGDAPRQFHTLAIAEQDDSARAIVAAVMQAGLIPVSLIPIEGVAIVAATRHALDQARAGAAIVLHFGEHSSVVAGAAAGRLRFIRQIAIGSESLVDTLAREIRPSKPGAAPFTLSREEARVLVERTGIPAREQVLDAARGLEGDVVLPLIQPVIQRCLVEIKQSLRFGLDEAQRTAATLYGIGPAAATPRLLALIGEQCGLQVPVAANPSPAGGPSAEGGAIRAFVTTGAAGISLLPRALAQQTNVKALQRCLWTGIAVAGLLVAGDAFLARQDLSSQRAANASLQKRLDEAATAVDIRSRLFAVQSGLAAARQRMNARMGAEADWDAVLAVLATTTPRHIRLSEVEMKLDSGRPTMRIAGATPLNGGQDAALKSYLDALAAVPIFRSCRLGATQRADSIAGPMQSFEMSLTLVDLPQAPPGPQRAILQATAPEEKP
jgi:Tfp pilus assembly protein PilN